jgi:hypothetical protein
LPIQHPPKRDDLPFSGFFHHFHFGLFFIIGHGRRVFYLVCIDYDTTGDTSDEIM